MPTLQPLLIAGQWRQAQDLCGHFRAEDPATGSAIGPEFPVCGAADLETALAAATEVAAALAAASPAQIADFFEAYVKGIGREIGRRRVGKECRSRWSPYH